MLNPLHNHGQLTQILIAIAVIILIRLVCRYLFPTRRYEPSAIHLLGEIAGLLYLKLKRIRR